MPIDRKALCDAPSKTAQIELKNYIDPLLRRPDVLRVTGLTQSSMYRLIKANTFPQPVQITEGTNGWRQSEIVKWIDQRPRVAL